MTTITVDQRKALAKIIEDKISDADFAISSKNNLINDETEKQIKAKMNTDIIDNMLASKIKELDLLQDEAYSKRESLKENYKKECDKFEQTYSKIESAKKAEISRLRNMKEKLTGDYNSYYRDNVRSIQDSFDLDGREVRKQRHEYLTEIWTVQTVEEAEIIVEKVDDIVKKHEAILDEVKPKMLAAINQLAIPTIDELDAKLTEEEEKNNKRRIIDRY
jgi:hypothetical protein